MHDALMDPMRTYLVSDSTATVPRSRRLAVIRTERILDYVFGVIYALLLVRLALEFFNARKGAGFVQIIDSLTDTLYAPFKGILASSSIDGSPLVWSLVVAVLGYMLLHAGLRGLLRLITRV